LNRTKLKEKMRESGYRFAHIVGQVGISYQCFCDKMRGKTDFTRGEVEAFSAILGLTPEERDNIFFAPSTNLKIAGAIPCEVSDTRGLAGKGRAG